MNNRWQVTSFYLLRIHMVECIGGTMPLLFCGFDMVCVFDIRCLLFLQAWLSVLRLSLISRVQSQYNSDFLLFKLSETICVRVCVCSSWFYVIYGQTMFAFLTCYSTLHKYKNINSYIYLCVTFLFKVKYIHIHILSPHSYILVNGYSIVSIGNRKSFQNKFSYALL